MTTKPVKHCIASHSLTVIIMVPAELSRQAFHHLLSSICQQPGVTNAMEVRNHNAPVSTARSICVEIGGHLNADEIVMFADGYVCAALDLGHIGRKLY